jgi:hypothetical protein
MSVATEREEIQTTVDSICEYILQMVSAKGELASELRRQIGMLRVNALQYLHDKTFGTNMWNCFVSARTLPITADLVSQVRIQIQALPAPVGLISVLIMESAIIYCLTTESIFITQMEFTSADDAQAMMKKMKDAFDSARDQAADRMDSSSYQNLTYLSGSLINHLYATALLLPRVVQFEYQKNYPSLVLANLIYQDTTRSDELIAGNKIVHPLFMPREIIGLSA